MQFLKIVLLGFLGCGIFFPCVAQNPKEKLQELFETIDSSQRLIGSVSISKAGAPSLNYTFGNHLKSETGEKMLPDQQVLNMRIGTLSQTFTAVLIFQCIEEGKLELETTLNTFFPEFPNAETITIRQLLTQSSGLHDIEKDISENIFESWYYSPQSSADLRQRISNTTSDFLPGDSVSYASSNFISLALILEKVSNEVYDDLLLNRILHPCDMDYSSPGFSSDALAFEIPSYYRNETWVEFPSSHLSGRLGDAHAISNCPDLAKFYHALFSGKLITQNSLKSLLELGTCLQLTKDYAISTSGMGYTAFGGIDNFSSAVLYVPEDSTCVVIMLAGINYPISQLFWKTIELNYGQESSLPNFKPIVIPARSTKKYSGKFVSSDGIVVEIIARDEDIFFELDEKGFGKLKLEALDENWFQFEPKGIMIRFGRNEKNKIDHFLYHQGREVVKFTKTGS